jgi:hypothetical protein
MSSPAKQPLVSALTEIIDILTESRIKLDALERVMKEINPLLHERYLGEIDNVREAKTSELNQRLRARLEAGFTKS